MISVPIVIKITVITSFLFDLFARTPNAIIEAWKQTKSLFKTREKKNHQRIDWSTLLWRFLLNRLSDDHQCEVKDEIIIYFPSRNCSQWWIEFFVAGSDYFELISFNKSQLEVFPFSKVFWGVYWVSDIFERYQKLYFMVEVETESFRD
jgi:hypothetical protein